MLLIMDVELINFFTRSFILSNSNIDRKNPVVLPIRTIVGKKVSTKAIVVHALYIIGLVKIGKSTSNSVDITKVTVKKAFVAFDCSFFVTSP